MNNGSHCVAPVPEYTRTNVPQKNKNNTMKTALITGACGFVGSAIAQTLLGKGWQVHLLDLPGNPLWESLPASPRCNRFEGDIRDRHLVRMAARGCTHIFHTAALLNSIAPRDAFLDINVNGTRNLCEIALENKVQHFIYVSTSDVFGIPEEGEVITERTPYRPWNEPYADSKIEASRVVKQFIREHSLPATLVYPGWVYGPGDRQFFPAIMQMVRDRWVFTWHRRRPYEVDLIHIDDLMRAILAMLDTPLSVGEDYLILDRATKMTPESFYRQVADVMGARINVLKVPYPLMMLIAWVSQALTRKGITQKHLLSTTDVKAFGNDFHFSTEKARKHLNWQPAISAREGVRKAVEWQLQQSAEASPLSSGV